MEVVIDVWAEYSLQKNEFQPIKLFYFCGSDQSGRPIDVPQAVPETEDEIALYEGALRRRQLRLVLAGRMKAQDAVELKSIFE
jgi:acyl-CoA hydrolase